MCGPLPSRRPHKFGPAFISVAGRRVEELDHDEAELLEVDGLGDVAVEAGLDALRVDVAENVGGEGDYGHVWVAVRALPPPDLLARLVAVFVGHVQVALWCWLAGSERRGDRCMA